MKKILLTGASGFFGRNLLKTLQERSEDFQCFCIYNSKKFEIADSRFSWVQANLLDDKERKNIIKEIKPTHCVHLAWHVPPQLFWKAPENIVWLYSSVCLFQNFCENGGRLFIGAGTLAEYAWGDGILHEEKTPFKPETLYGQCKKSLLEIISKFRDSSYPQVNIIWPRIGYFFGPNEPPEKFITKLIISIQKSVPLNLAHPEFSRPYAHVRYFGEAISNILMSNNMQDLVFNLSASHSYTLKEIVDFISQYFKKNDGNIFYNAYSSPNSNPMTLSVNTEILENTLHYKIPPTFFEDLTSFMVTCNVKNA